MNKIGDRENLFSAKDQTLVDGTINNNSNNNNDNNHITNNNNIVLIVTVTV